MNPQTTVGNATLYTGDAETVLATLPSESVHCVVTSVPYFGLRSYLSADHPDKAQEIGLEASVEIWLERLVCVFREVRRVMRKDATLWLNVGDSFAAGGRGLGTEGSKQRTNIGSLIPGQKVPFGYKPKDLMMLPARLALALQADGWWLRSEIVWQKMCPMPESVTDRPTSAHEKIFLFARSAKYWYDADAVRQKALFGRREWKGDNFAALHEQRAPASVTGSDAETGRNLWNVWDDIKPAPAPSSVAHYASYPTELPARCIAAGTSERGCCPQCGMGWGRVVEREKMEIRRSDYGDKSGNRTASSGTMLKPARSKTVGWQSSCGYILASETDLLPATVLDPFSGTASTGVAALRMGRRYIGIDLSEQYNEWAAERLRPYAAQTRLAL